MASYGDLISPQRRLLGGLIRIPMSTAIVRTYTPDGFVIAADGRARNNETGAIITENAQKVFSLGNRFLAYAFAGAVKLGPPHIDSDEVVFDLAAEVRASVEAISPRRYRNLNAYATRIAKGVQRSLERAESGGKIEYPKQSVLSPAECGCTIANVFVDGYFDTIPSRIKVRLYHYAGRLADPEVFSEKLNQGTPLLHGSVDVADLVPQDSRFARYRMLPQRPFHESADLAAAINISKCYIEAFSGPEALEVDEAFCSGIGGHIHIATVTPRGGFQWVPGFEPMPAQ